MGVGAGKVAGSAGVEVEDQGRVWSRSLFWVHFSSQGAAGAQVQLLTDSKWMYVFSLYFFSLQMDDL